MIHPNDVLVYHDTGVHFRVARVGARDIQVVHDADEPDYMYPELNPVTLELMDVSKWGLVACPHTVTQGTTTTYGAHLIERLAYNNGMMESALESQWRWLKLMDTMMESGGSVRVWTYITEAIESIKRTAENMKDFPRPNGTEDKSSLFNLIYADRK